MDVVEIPTNLPVQRIDRPDSIFKTKKEKLNAIVEQINESYRKGQPVLVGTINIDASEELSHMLSKKKIPHKVLNATPSPSLISVPRPAMFVAIVTAFF